MRNFYSSGRFPNSVRFLNNFKYTKHGFHDFIRIHIVFGRHFQTARRMNANNMPLDRYGNCATFTLLSGFEIMHGLKTISNKLYNVFADFFVSVLYFGRHFQTVCRIDASDTPLESYEKCATYLFLANFRNSLQFKSSFENK